MFLKADLDHGGGDAELGRRDEARRRRLSRGQRGEGVDDEIEHDERGGHEQQIGVVDQRADVQTRAEHDEEERDEEALRDAADLSRQALRSSDRGHDEAHAESAEEHAGPALLRDPRQTEEHGQRETQIQRPAASLGALAQTVNPGARAQRAGDEEDDQRTRGDEQAAECGVGGPAGLEHERNGEDRCHVGDRDLRDDDQRLWAVELSFLQRRQHDRRRARGQKDAVHGGMAGPGELGRDQATERRGDRGHARRQRAGSEGARRRRSRSGTCMPTVSISMAKPASARNDTVASSASMTSRPLRPRTTPARISPTTTGTNARRLAASSGPARPAATISARSPRLTWSRGSRSRRAPAPARRADPRRCRAGRGRRAG